MTLIIAQSIKSSVFCFLFLSPSLETVDREIFSETFDRDIIILPQIIIQLFLTDYKSIFKKTCF